MKKAKSRIKKKVTIKTVIIASLIVSSLWSAVFYLLTKPEPIPELLIIEKIEIKEVEKVDEYVPSPATLKAIEKRPGVAGDINRKFGKEWRYWAELIARESCLNPGAINPTSFACGIPQSLPCEKMECSLDLEGIDCQLEWIKEYTIERYGSIQHALVFHDVFNWY